MIPNRWAERCAECGKRVRPARFDASGTCIEQFGYAERTGHVNVKTGKPVWVTRHVACVSPDAAVPAERRDTSPSGGRVMIRESDEPGIVLAALVAGSDPERTALALVAQNVDAGYRGRLSDAWTRPGYAVSEAALRPFIVLAHKSGLTVEVSANVHARLRTSAAAASTAALAGSARIAELRKELGDRGMALRGYQEEGIEFLASRPASLLADEMGTGKSAQSILSMGRKARAIVVCPAGLIFNWRDEFGKWSPETKLIIKQGRGTLVTPGDPGSVTICSYEAVGDGLHVTGDGSDIVLVFDEAHYLKGGTRTARSRRARVIAHAVRSAGGRVIELTGSPLKNDLDELWTVLDVAGLGQELFGSKRRMRKLYNDNHDLYIETLRRGMLRREKKDVLTELPPKVYVRRVVEITAEHRERLDAALAEIRAFAGQRAVEALRAQGPATSEQEHEAYAQAEANVDEAIRLVFESDAPIPFELISRVKSILALAKMEASMGILRELDEEDPSSPVLFFSTHVAPVMSAAGLPGWSCIHGQVDPEERQRRATEYQAGGLRGMAITIRAGGVGLNLPRGYREVFNDREWTPADNEQAEDRAHRIGQTGDMLWICDVVADHPLDYRIFELNAEKRKVAARAVSAATLKATERAQRAFADDVLAMVTTERPERLDIVRRDPVEAELEAAEFLLASKEPDLFARTITSDLREHEARLTDAQWKSVVRWAREHGFAAAERATDEAEDGASRSARTEEERWTARALATLASGIDATFNAHDGPSGAVLAEKLARVGLSDGEWSLATMMCRKYRSLATLRPSSGEDRPKSTLRGSIGTR